MKREMISRETLPVSSMTELLDQLESTVSHLEHVYANITAGRDNTDAADPDVARGKEEELAAPDGLFAQLKKLLEHGAFDDVHKQRAVDLLVSYLKHSTHRGNEARAQQLLEMIGTSLEERP